MTAKEKAGELVIKYSIIFPTIHEGRNWSGLPVYQYDITLAKQCAKIAIDELIYYAESKYQLDWFREIRNELEKL